MTAKKSWMYTKLQQKNSHRTKRTNDPSYVAAVGR